MLCHVVIMDCRGLVDPQNKPFGRVLPLEVQIRIMFWVHCFYTIDKRRKVVRELKRLPKCNVTGLPQRLGEGRWWNQVVFRINAPRGGSHCHHCLRIMDHRLSVREHRVVVVVVMGLKKGLRVLFVLVSDWDDDGNGAADPEPGQPHE